MQRTIISRDPQGRFIGILDHMYIKVYPRDGTTRTGCQSWSCAAWTREGSGKPERGLSECKVELQERRGHTL